MLAVAVDLVQFALLPVELTPLNNVIDVATALAMVALVGWHWAFLPTFLAEMMPFVDLIPTWTLAVMFVTRGKDDLAGPSSRVPPPSLPPPAGGQSRDASGS